MKKNRVTKSGRKKSLQKSTLTKSGRKKSLQKSTLTKSSPRKWSDKYKKSINCKKPKGFSQRQFCLKKSLN
jgi:hypothetical protein